VILPPTLRPGDRVALVAPAGPVDDAKIDTALKRCAHLGLVPVPGRAIRSKNGYLAGSDQERAADLRLALEGDASAIWALRGGYGALRTLEHVDLQPFRARPRAYIGFSDNTAIHLALHRMGVVSYHGPHAGYEHFPEATERAFRAVLMEAGPAGVLPRPDGLMHITMRDGVAEGPLVGGNLALLAAVCGTRHQPDTRGAILFIEDVAEPLYRIDRMITQIRLAGLLDHVAGVALGEFTAMPDPVDEAASDGEPTLEAVLGELLEPLDVPTVLGLPFGHGKENWTLPLGVTARLDASTGTLELLEPATGEGTVA
jgi:muramoyltetrapeptide carboxypeptidase